MPDIKFTMNVAIANGPTIGVNQTVTVDGYDKLDVTVGKAGTATVPLQPSDKGFAQFLVIISDWYGSTLSYTINDATDSYVLDQPLLLSGQGGITLFTDPPQKLVLKNTDTKDANVQILVGRKIKSA